MRAYYNANAGLQFIQSMQKASENSLYANQFVANMMEGASAVTYSISPNDGFTYSVVNNTISQNEYDIEYIVGSVDAEGNNAKYNYKIDPVLGVKYTYTGSSGGGPSGSGLSKNLLGAKGAISFGGDLNGNIAASTIDMNEGSNLTGSIVSTSSTQMLTVTKNVVGTVDNPIEICSNSDIELATSGNVLYGDVYSQGGVVIGRPVVGTVRAVGAVTFNSNASVTGDVYTQGTIDTTNGHIYGTAHVNSYGDISGSGDYENVVIETVAAPKSCTTELVFPGHETPSTSTDFDATNNELCVNKQCTFTGKDLNDHSYSYRNFTIPWGYNVCFDLSSGYVNIFVSGDMTVTPQNVYIKTTSSQKCFKNTTKLPQSLNLSYKEYASKLFADVTGKFSIQGGVWFGTVYGGTGVKLGSGTWMTGALYCSDGDITGLWGGRPDIHMDYVESTYFSKR
ncbi:bactofilin family protein [Solidesulfovibrio fructosivorans]|nr:polymer-forming cytoskeletal protein [Solidesulfovibrio fructosivorans]